MVTASRRPPKVYILGTLASLVIRLLYLTLRWERMDVGPHNGIWTAHEQKINVFWHGRMLMLAGIYWRKRREFSRPLSILISLHGDGRLIAYAIKRLGLGSVAGSSSRRAAASMLELVKLARDGSSIGFTPDGPRGPARVCKHGAVALAQVTGLPIYPVSYSAKHRWQLSSWDGMIIPKPFSSAVALTGEPIMVGPDEELGVAAKRVQDALNELTDRADTYWNAP